MPDLLSALPAGTAGITQARTQQGEQFYGAPQQGAAESKCRMGDQATHHDVHSFESAGSAGRVRAAAENAGSEIIQLPDHHPGFVEQAVDVAEEAIDENLHGVLPFLVAADGTTIALQYCSRFSRR